MTIMHIVLKYTHSFLYKICLINYFIINLSFKNLLVFHASGSKAWRLLGFVNFGVLLGKLLEEEAVVGFNKPIVGESGIIVCGVILLDNLFKAL